MMPVIRISDRTFKRLQSYAVPLQDSVDDVVNRALDYLERAASTQAPTGLEKIVLDDDFGQKFNAAPGITGDKVPQREFRQPLIDFLSGAGGGAEVRVVREKIEPIVKPMLLRGDYAKVTTGDPRWWNAICWERNDMVKEGILRSDSRRGYWELSELGRSLAK